MNDIDKLFFKDHFLHILPSSFPVELRVLGPCTLNYLGVGKILVDDDRAEFLKELLQKGFIVFRDVHVCGFLAEVAFFFMDDQYLLKLVDDFPLVLVAVLFEGRFHKLAELVQVLDELVVLPRFVQFLRFVSSLRIFR